jgi:ElaB/YqjD/DUF883 family membrane-anchored ribosome-binding protein
MSADTSVTKDKLVQDLKIIAVDFEEMLKFVASGAVDKAAGARERMQDNLHKAKVKLAEAEDAVIQKAKQTAHVTDEYVHENPWRAVGIAAGVGLVIGLLIGRR